MATKAAHETLSCDESAKGEDMKDISVISGGASGMGKESARRLAKDGPILIFDINEPLLKEVHQEFEGAGFEVYSMVADIREPEQLDELVKYAMSIGNVKNVVHAAAWDFNTVEPMPEPQASEEIVKSVVYGTKNMVDAFLPIMENGSFITFTSLAADSAELVDDDYDLWEECYEDDFWDRIMERVNGLELLFGMPQHAYHAYCYAKAFCCHFTAMNASRFGEKGCHIVAVAPGSFDTPLLAPQKAAQDGHGAENLASVTALGRIGQPEEMAELVYDLCQPLMFYITGVNIRMDGGVFAVTKTSQFD